MVTRQLSDNQYPDFLLNGGPIAFVLKALSDRLKIAFQEKIFTHHIIAPNAGKKMWDAVLKTSPLVAVSFASWKRSSRLSSGFFRGDLTFPVFIALQHNTPEALMLGSGQLRGMGVAGVMSMAAAMLDGWTLDGVGTAEMQVAELPPTADWLEERMALVALNIVFPDVGFDAGSDAAMLDGLNDFLQLAEKSQVNGQAEPDAVLNVRDQKMTVKVAVPKGRTVLDARGRKCPAGVFSVNERDPFWARLLRFGDIVRVDAKPVTETKPVAVSATKEASPK